MRGFAVIVVAMLCILSWTEAPALPRFALVAGAKCASCHVNPTGGQMRNDYGLTFGMDNLPMRTTKAEGPEAEDAFSFSPKISDNITLGADFRAQLIVEQESLKSSIHLMTMSLYGSIQLQKKLTLYFKQDIANPEYDVLQGPEVYLLAKVLPGAWYIKAGDFLPDYGWRLDDHSAYVRGGDLGFLPGATGHHGLLFFPNYKDIGLEIGGQTGGLFVAAGLYSGTGNNRKIYFETAKAYAMKIEYGGNIDALNFRLGASGYGFRAYKMGGVHLGLGTQDVAFLGEIDFTHSTLIPYALPSPGAVNPAGNAMAAYGELDIRAMQGIWLIGKFDVFDPVRGVASDEIKRLTVGLEFFPYPFVELRPQYRFAMETPSIDNNQGLVQMHVWF